MPEFAAGRHRALPAGRRAAIMDVMSTEPLPSLVAPALRILFVGINPSLRSAEVGHHFAGRGNPFWRLLAAAGLTPAPLSPEEDARLLDLGMGVTNVCPRPTRSAAELSPDELRAGARALRDAIAGLRPRVVALVGISLLRVVVPGSREPGPGAKRRRLHGARLFVLPNPSGLNAAYPGFRHKLAWFRRLRRVAGREAERPRTGRNLAPGRESIRSRRAHARPVHEGAAPALTRPFRRKP